MTVSASFYQVYPSEYAFYKNSVYRTERASANCRNYRSSLKHSVRSEDYIHCNGTPLRLTDSDYGLEKYNTSDYYVWTVGSVSQLLFIFPTRVNLTNITLHYYNDSSRGLPRLRFYAVPDDFDVWDAPSASNSYVEVAAVQSGAESARQRNISTSFCVTTKKILLIKFNSGYSFALSEIEFFSNSCSSLNISSLTRDPTTASQYHFYVTEIASTISMTLSKLLVSSKTIIIIIYVSLCCSSSESVKLPFIQVVLINELLSMNYNLQI